MKTPSADPISKQTTNRVLWAAACCLAMNTACIAATVEPAPAQQCLNDLKSFDTVMRKDGYWFGAAGYGYGYPVYGYGYSYGNHYPESLGFGRARPGYELRTLLSTAQILAAHGQQQSCEAVLNGARDLYSTYVTELRKGQIPPVDVPSWRRQQIESAVAVTDDGVAHRADQLIGTSIVNNRDEGLGSVEDIVMSPKTGKIAYLLVGHGGLWGIDEKYAPVPWADFKSAISGNLLVLPVTQAVLEAAPQVQKDAGAGTAEFAAQSLKVDAYWVAHPPVARN